MSRVNLEQALRLQNRFMVGFDLALGTGALLAPDQTLLVLGHDEPSPEARRLFQRCGPIWLTFAAAHAIADRRGEPQDWWALAWLRGTEMLADPIWSSSPGWRRPGSRPTLWFSGAANTAMTAGFAWMASRKPTRRPRLLRR
jgi:hypothetical protein